MQPKLSKTLRLAQVAASALIIIFGASCSLRCLLSGNILCSVLFAILSYACGYRLMLRSSISELLHLDIPR